MEGRVLVVEDDASIREVTALGLRRAGFRVDTAVDGRQALVAWRARPVDVIVLDVMLPGLDGLQVCREIRRTSQVPILMLTARTDTLDVVVGLECGADDYLRKPFDLPELTATEFRLLLELARRPGQVFTRELLLDLVWNHGFLGDSRLVDVAVQRLRAKVEDDRAHPRLVQTVRGAGYKLSTG
ncbi:response regulator transcription factor [Micromonospora sp. ALFpr18c]|uniref:response regulator transcription factor n=1 Tax=Micromonospora sp. ALFpr18c TaxID=1458665 RepID=UPI00124B1DAC|nr:response regulator transcription factor [Micromonospora sp. ALFpr18c]KAB1937298.1 response regulator transcription factor [Micromonospora sp. ALFpr18c]